MLGPKMKAFLAAYEETGSVVRAAKAAGIQRQLHYRALEKSVEYRTHFEEAEKRFGDALEGHARKLARDGVREPVFFQGIKCGSRLKYSPALIIAMLKALKPEKYRERFEHTGPDGGPIQIDPTCEKLTDDELDLAIKLAGKLAATRRAGSGENTPAAE